MGLTVYKASAGSGKTYTLAVEYIAVLLRHPEAYNNILAATFTNKAAAELKSRVIKVLSLLSSGDHAEGYFTTLKDKTQMSDHDIKRNAGIALKKILHDYSRFSVSTIDRFFNRILSSFMYEVNIRPDSEISLDDVVNREEALDELLINFDVSTPLGRWLMAYAKSKIEDEKNWNIRWELSNESKAITSETFLAREQMLGNLSQDKGKLEKYRDKIYGIIKKHEAEAKQTGKKARELIDGSAFSISDFSNTMNGPAGFLLRLQKEGFKKGITKRAAEATDDPLKFLTQSNQSRADLRQFVEEKLHPLLQHIVTYIENNEKDFYTAVAIASNINSFGVLLDINHELRKICSERQIYFPFQMAQLLHDIVSLDNALWVYEKIGTQYKHYLLDEFQDTSRMQWDILKPLLEESLGSGGETLIVGDVKQSIYRWRNGDWNMLSHEVEQQFPHGNQKSLKYNYRSRRDIVRFNNHLMDALIPVFQQHIDSKLNNDNQPEFDLTALYDQYIQTPNKTNSPFGHVKIRFPDGDGDNDENWKEKAMDEMVQEMTTLMDKGYSPGDMAVLVNKNTEAGQIAMRIMEEDKNSGYGFPVVSAASLLLKENNLVQVILSALAWIDQPDNHIALTQLVYTYQTEVLQNKDYKPRPEQSGDKAVADAMKQDLPTAFVSLKNKLAGWPLYDLTENIIQWFDLHKHQEAYAYLNAFQDQILQYSQNNPVEIASFLQWFDKKGPKLEMPDSAGSIVVSTVHKAKGLEFRFVFMPFTDWRLKTPGKTPRLWVEPEHSPFDEIPLVMVNASSDLEKSHFVDEYKEEEFNQHVDMLNKFYVAVTRAEEGLYIWAPPAKGKAANMHNFLYTALKNAGNSSSDNKLDNWQACFDENNAGFILGDVPACEPDKKQKQQKALVLNDYPLNMPLNSMRYHHPDAFIQLDQDELILHKTNRGSVCHAVLEMVKVREDLPEALEQMVRAGRITRDEVVELEQLLDKAMAQEPVRSWFRNDVRVINEQEILMPEGRFIKPDRVLIEEQKAVVIDYKFGKRHNKQYAEQVREYMQELTKMGYKQVVGYIWYVFAGDVHEVSL